MKTPTVGALIIFCLVAGVVTAQQAPTNSDIPAIAKAANGVVVSIITSDKDAKPIAQGTGFLVSKDGRILTNYHVIKNAISAVVKLPSGAFFDVDGVLAFDKARDIAIIKAHGQGFRIVTLGDSDRVQVGEAIVAIGSPLSLDSTVSSGIVSGIRSIDEEGGKFLQVTAPISPGSSGGPLFNMAGEVVGITAMYLKGGENLNFAIPINDAKRLLAAGSEVQGFPVETDVAKTETTPNVSRNPTTARDYYKQIYDAGGLSPVSGADFVCFHDKPNLQWFFTFSVSGYDERYAKAMKAYMETRRDKTTDTSEYRHTMQSVKASHPNVNFMDEDWLSIIDSDFGAGTEAHLRSGGLLLFYNSYDRGVINTSGHFRGVGKMWTFDLSPSLNQTDKIVISIEPTTLRYVEAVSGTVVVSGRCEKIPSKPSNQ